MVDAFEKIYNVKPYYKITDKKTGDLRKVYADLTKTNQELRWKAKRTLEDYVGIFEV